MKTHYESLEVDISATRDEIKKAYRKLCLQTHPDVAPSSKSSPHTKSANAEKFRQISEAHRILTDDSARKRYDFEVREAQRFGRPLNHSHGFSGTSSQHGHHAHKSSSRAHSFGIAMLEGVYRPKNLFLGLTLGFLSVSMIKSYIQEPDDPRKRTGFSNKVEAWKNPRTGLWEQPAPWDPLYQRLKPKLVMVARDQVRPSQR